MISVLEKKIIFRYLKSRKKDSFLNLITIFSFLGISLGVAVLIIVMSVMNGFRSELIDKIIGFNAHIVIKPYEKNLDFKKLKNKNIQEIIENYLISNNSEGIVINKDYTKGILLRGYKKNSFKKLEIVQNKKFKGNKNLNPKHISIGRELSLILNLDIGDKLILMSPAGIETIIGSLPKQEAFIVDSIFESGLTDFDQNIAFLNLEDLESLFNLNKFDRNIELYLKYPNKIEISRSIVNKIFDEQFIYSWSDLNKQLFSALKVERNVMFIILSLIIIVAAFNIISGLTILVKNKTKEIAILKSIGVQNISIKKIFFMIGLIIGLFATIFGVILGITFSIYIEEVRIFISEVFKVTIFPEEIYFLNKMPSEINLRSICVISLISIIITSLVSIYPASKAAKLDPAQSLKYE